MIDLNHFEEMVFWPTSILQYQVVVPISNPLSGTFSSLRGATSEVILKKCGNLIDAMLSKLKCSLLFL